MPSPVALSVPLLVLASACVAPREEITPLAEVEQLQVDIHVWPAALHVEIKSSRTAEDPCLVLSPDVTARIGEVPVPLESRGRFSAEFDGGNECKAPTIHVVELPPIGDATLELADSSATLRCSLGNELVPRRALPIAEAVWSFAAGQVATLRWSHPGDLGQFPIELWLSQDTTSIERAQAQPVPGTDRFTFPIPRVTPGSYQLHWSTLTHATYEPGQCGEGTQTSPLHAAGAQPIMITP